MGYSSLNLYFLMYLWAFSYVSILFVYFDFEIVVLLKTEKNLPLRI